MQDGSCIMRSIRTVSYTHLMIQGGFLFYGIVGNVKIAVFRNEELVPLGTVYTVDVDVYKRQQLNWQCCS